MEHTKLPPKMLMLQIGATPMYGIHIEGETSFIATDLTKKDAIYIVRTVNSHDELLAACEAVLRLKDLWYFQSDAPEHRGESEALATMHQTLEAAIKKAKGKQ